MKSEVVAMVNTFTTLFLVLSIIVILIRARTIELRLILIGIFMAVAAAAVSNGMVAAADNPAALGFSLGLGSTALFKVGVLLILAGLALLILNHPTAAPAVPAREEAPHAG